MLKKIIYLFLFIALSIGFSSCLVSHGNTTARSFIPLTKDSTLVRSKNKQVALYFTGEPINFTYQKLGYLTVQSNQYTSTSDLLDHLKYEAWKQGANAVITITDSETTREQSIGIVDKNKTTYTARTFKGLAVLANENELPQLKSDTTFVYRMSEVDRSNGSLYEGQLVASLILFIALIGVGIYALAHR
jgi:hypothetical protein